MILIERKELIAGFRVEIRHGQRKTYALYLHSGKIKTFWSMEALNDFLKSLNLEAGA